MAMRKRTLRKLSPTTRKVARLVGELESVARRLKNLYPEIQSLELDSQALTNASLINQQRKEHNDRELFTTSPERI
mgnify:CR=1 FL=1